MNKPNMDSINQLRNFKKSVIDWRSAMTPSQRGELRSRINQNLPSIKRIVAEAGCQKRIDIAPPPLVGGMIMRNVDPFDIICQPPYAMNPVPLITDIIDQTIGTLKANPELAKKLGTTDTIAKQNYVDPTRIQEVEAISSDEFDATKLVKMCEELNTANSNSCHMTIAMLVRAIIDHVPPMLGYDTFREVANNYNGTKSFSDSMKHLEESMRKISDSILHTKIRKKEILPTFVQVDFSADLDVLLGEIIRVNKQ
jgi:hypothetical protein